MQNVYGFSMFAVTSCNMDQLWKIGVLYFITYLKSTVWKNSKITIEYLLPNTVYTNSITTQAKEIAVRNVHSCSHEEVIVNIKAF